MARARAALVSALAILSGAAGARATERTPVLATPHFNFYNDFETNLNDALIAAGAARKAGKPEALAACLTARPAA